MAVIQKPGKLVSGTQKYRCVDCGVQTAVDGLAFGHAVLESHTVVKERFDLGRWRFVYNVLEDFAERMHSKGLSMQDLIRHIRERTEQLQREIEG
jgi:hypothetical protein